MSDGEKNYHYATLRTLALIENIIRNKIPTGIYNVSDTVNYSYNDLLKYVKSKRDTYPSIVVKFSFYW